MKVVARKTVPTPAARKQMDFSSGQTYYILPSSYTRFQYDNYVMMIKKFRELHSRRGQSTAIFTSSRVYIKKTVKLKKGFRSFCSVSYLQLLYKHKINYKNPLVAVNLKLSMLVMCPTRRATRMPGKWCTINSTHFTRVWSSKTKYPLLYR